MKYFKLKHLLRKSVNLKFYYNYRLKTNFFFDLLFQDKKC